MCALNARQRIDGSTPCTSTRSRGARGAGASKISTVGQTISRSLVSSSCKRCRAVGLEVVELLGVDAARSAARRAPRRGRRPRSRRRRRRRSSPETRRPWPGPSGRRDGGPRSAAASEPPYIMGRWPPPATRRAETPRRSRRCARARRSTAVFACTRKERQISRAGTPYLNIELRDSTGTILARAFRDADVLAGRFERGELVRVQRPRRALPRGAADRASQRSRAPRARRPTRRASCPSPTATWTSSRASSSTSRARSTTRR